jgi:hypothetical protein
VAGFEAHRLELLAGIAFELVAAPRQRFQFAEPSGERVALALERREVEQLRSRLAGRGAARRQVREARRDEPRAVRLEPVDLGSQRSPRGGGVGERDGRLWREELHRVRRL